MKLKIFCDGGSRGNPGPSAAGFVVFDDAGNLQDKRGKYLGTGTNNEAEYQAVILALDWAKQVGQVEQVDFFLDSSLVVNQVNGLFKVKEPRLRELVVLVHEGEQALFPLRITYSHIPREKNAQADLLVNETLDKEILG